MGSIVKVVSRIALSFRIVGNSHEARQFSALNPDLVPFAAGHGDAESRLCAALELLDMVVCEGEFVEGVAFATLRAVEFAEGDNPLINGVQYHFYIVDVARTEPDDVRLLPYLDSDTDDPFRELRLRFRRAFELDELTAQRAVIHTAA